MFDSHVGRWPHGPSSLRLHPGLPGGGRERAGHLEPHPHRPRAQGRPHLHRRGLGPDHAPPRRAAVLTLHPGRLVPLLEESGLVHHQHPIGVGQMLHNIAYQVVTNQISIPPVAGQQALHPVGGWRPPPARPVATRSCARLA